jgi:hypothetical protein
MASPIKVWNTYLGKGKIVGFMNEIAIELPKSEQACTGFPENESERIANKWLLIIKHKNSLL